MKKTILLSLILACGTLMTRSQGLTNATLWKITAKGNENPSFILLAGPVCSSSMTLSAGTKRALTQVRTIAMDYNLYDSRDAAKFQAYTLASADSQRIRNNLSTGEFQAFNDIMKNNGIPDNLAQQFYAYKIGMLYYLLLMLNSPCGVLTGQSSYETILRPYAKKNNLEYLIFQNIDDYLA